MNGIVCPECDAYLGLNATTVSHCPKCKTSLALLRQELDDEYEAESTAELIAKEKRHHFRIGSLMLILGLVLTLGSMSTASVNNGSYFIYWGLILFGVMRIFNSINGSTPTAIAHKRRRKNKTPNLVERSIGKPMLMGMGLGVIGPILYGVIVGKSIGFFIGMILSGLLLGMGAGLMVGLLWAVCRWLFFPSPTAVPIAEPIPIIYQSIRRKRRPPSTMDRLVKPGVLLGAILFAIAWNPKSDDRTDDDGNRIRSGRGCIVWRDGRLRHRRGNWFSQWGHPLVIW